MKTTKEAMLIRECSIKTKLIVHMDMNTHQKTQGWNVNQKIRITIDDVKLV